MGQETARPLLATKLFSPPLRGNIVTRPRLLELLDNGRSQPLILVTAPAGFGKTTLVSCWLKRRQKRAGWVSLDKTDNIPANFITYIVEAFQQVSGGTCGTITPLLKSAEPPDIDILLSYLINDLACLEEPIILVLDDYHVIEEKRIHQALDFIVDVVLVEQWTIARIMVDACRQIGDVAGREVAHFFEGFSFYVKFL